MHFPVMLGSHIAALVKRRGAGDALLLPLEFARLLLASRDRTFSWIGFAEHVVRALVEQEEALARAQYAGIPPGFQSSLTGLAEALPTLQGDPEAIRVACLTHFGQQNELHLQMHTAPPSELFLDPSNGLHRQAHRLLALTQLPNHVEQLATFVPRLASLGFDDSYGTLIAGLEFVYSCTINRELRVTPVSSEVVDIT